MRGNSELLECVHLARQVQDGSITWQAGCAEICRRVIAGRVNPNDACSLLAEVSASIRSPSTLSGFEHLAQLQYGHDSLGYNADSIASEIIEECKNVIVAAG